MLKNISTYAQLDLKVYYVCELNVYMKKQVEVISKIFDKNLLIIITNIGHDPVCHKKSEYQRGF